MSGLCCTFTGHRASKLPWGFHEGDPRCAALKQRIFDVTEAIYSSGVTDFICGMANGCDLYFAEAVLALKTDHPEIELEAAIPYPGQADKWITAEQERYERILRACHKRTVISEEYTRSCMMERNRYMVDHSSILIVCYDDRPGGTLATLRYALKKGLEVVQIPVEILE